MGMSYAPVNIEITDALIKARDRVGLAIIMSLANRCSPIGVTDIGVYRLSEVSGYARETVQQKLIEFQELGWIKIRLINDAELMRKRYLTQLSPEVIYIRSEMMHEAMALWQRPAEIVMFCADSVTKDRQPESSTRVFNQSLQPDQNQLKTSVPTRSAREENRKNTLEPAQQIPIQSYSADYSKGKTTDQHEKQIPIQSYNESYKQLPASQIENLPASQIDTAKPPPVPAPPPHPAPAVETLVWQIKSRAPKLTEKLIQEWIETHGWDFVHHAYSLMCKADNVRNPAGYLRSMIDKKAGRRATHNPLDATSYLSRDALLGVKG
jgi:hypothetical protein